MTRRFSLAPLVYVALLMTPLYWLIVMSFKTNAEIGGQLTLFPHDPTLENYALIFSDPDWYMGYVNAIVYVLINVVISVGVALPAAYAFSRYDFFGHRTLFFVLLMFRMMAPSILLAPFVQIFSDLGLIDTHIAVAWRIASSMCRWRSGFSRASCPPCPGRWTRAPGSTAMAFPASWPHPHSTDRPWHRRRGLLLLHVLVDRIHAGQCADDHRRQAHRRHHDQGRRRADR